MPTQNKPEQLDLFNVSAVCNQNGCMHQKHFTSIRELQTRIEKLETALRDCVDCCACAEHETNGQQTLKGDNGE